MMREKGIGDVVVHPRYALEVEYLSEEWFEIFGWCLREAKARGMRLWICDDLNLPSGTAGMRVQKIDPNFRSKHLSVEAKPLSEIDLAGFQPGKVVIAANIEGGRVTKTRLIDDLDALSSLTGNWTVFNCTLCYDEFYVDTLSVAAVECFKNLTHEEYFKRFGDDFGKTIRAFFTDEPSIYWVSAGHDDWNLPYTDDFFETFEERFGYSPAERIPYLFYPGNAAFRADFWDHAGYLFNERYHGALGKWCRERGVIYTGHNHYEEPLRYQVRFQGNMFDAMRSMDIPGIDHLGKTTLGNYYISIIGHKICSSVAHFSGKARVMSESFGAMDWDTTFANLKRVADWQFALGINLLAPHALYHTISGPAKRECPPSFFYQSPHWDDFGHFAEYINRMEDMLTGGRHICKTAVMYPQSGLWASYQTDRNTSDFEHTDNFLNSLCLELVKHQVDFDILNFNALSEAELADGKLKIADEEYSVLIVPSTPYMRPNEVRRLTEIVKAGVYTALCHKSMEPGPQNMPDSLKGANFVRGDELVNFIEILRKNLNDDIIIDGGGTGDIMIYRREKDGRKITFLLNRSEKHRKVMAMIKDYPDPAIFDHETGSYTRLEGRKIGARMQAELRFQPGQSYFIVSNAPDAAPLVSLPSDAVAIPIKNLTASVPFNVASIYNFSYSKDSIAPIDVDIRANPRFIPVSWDKNPPRFEEYAGVYEAEIEINLPGEGIKLVLDKDYANCEVNVNDTRVQLHPISDEDKLPTSSGYLTDFQELWANVEALLKMGKNTFRVVSPTKLSEPLRLVGDFRVHVAGRLLALVPPGKIDPLQLDKDYPFYSGTVTYRAEFDLPSAYSPQELVLHNVNDTAEFWVNGQLAGRRLWAPYVLDIAPFTHIGANTLEIKVRNNMANLILGSANPLGLGKAPSLAGYE
ncbi:MAG: glycosyl hydrolase [Armatimonadetes bacterium]|nr:glycosyl hydrolase [Armatimonadota bacterium]